VYRKRQPQVGAPAGGQGRARNADIDARILAAAKRQLSVLGYEGMTLAAVAEEAGTTRQALYRRWANKADLAGDAVGTIDDAPTGPPAAEPQDPYRALVAELTDFQHGISKPGRLSLVGTMLQETTEPEVLEAYRARIIQPRRRRIAAILETAREHQLIDADPDLTIAVTLCTGGWYGRALAGDPAPDAWPERTAALVWRSLGGTPPA
jgi:AcrR family transcriptional regulator